MANYSQAQKQQYRLTLKNKRKHNKGTIRNFKGINQYESINPYLGA
jgi:ribosomal 30S subunit maturation factor RimM